ncbi:unknown [Clostridium sp. CAG:149]|nr:unknown [Clostridium sp. CAG:149]
MKSSRSMMVDPGPNGATALSTLKPRAQGRERIITTTRFTATAFFTEQPVRSVAKDTIFWNTAITVEPAANAMNTKNRLPQNLPPDILLNTLGRVTKIRDGPCPASIL